jgi:hypothetical protein
LATEFLDGADGWPGLVNVGGLGAWRSSGYTLVLAVPLLPRHATNSLAAGARGAYNRRFATLARNLVSQGFGDAYLRLGWEFNGNWYKWRVRSASNAVNYATFFRNVVTSMRSVPGQSFRFVWNPNDSGPSSYSPEQAYPGNAYVDYVGSDIYANCWCRPFTAQNGWADQLSQPWGLNWLASFAAEMGKPIVFPEWGVDFRSDGHGLGDDPYFVDHLAAWVDSHNVAWTSAFSFDGTHMTDVTDMTDGRFPNSLAAFRADFG